MKAVSGEQKKTCWGSLSSRRKIRNPSGNDGEILRTFSGTSKEHKGIIGTFLGNANANQETLRNC